MGVHKGVEQAQLNNKLPAGDRELEGGSRIPLTELDLNNMGVKETAQGILKKIVKVPGRGTLKGQE